MRETLTFEDTGYFEEITGMPKADLHNHIDGALPFQKLYQEHQRIGSTLTFPEIDLHGNPIVYSSEEERKIDSPEKLKNLQRGLITKYRMEDSFRPAIQAMLTREGIINMIGVSARELKSQNVIATEGIFAPIYHSKENRDVNSNLSMNQVIGYFSEGAAKAQEETGVNYKLTPCINREVDPDKGQDIARAILDFEDNGIVIAMGLACNEFDFPPELHTKSFQMTFDSSLKRRAHAGEMGKSDEERLKNVYVALVDLKVDGLAHALPLHKRYYKGHDLWQIMTEDNVRLESCPISNWQYFIENIADLNLDKLGKFATISSDDQGMWDNGTVNHNLYQIGKLYGPDFARKLARNSIKFSWGLTEEEKEGFLKEFH